MPPKKVVRSRLPIARVFLLPYLVVLLLFLTMTGAGSAWLYFKARQAQSELLIHGLLQTVAPVLDHIADSDITQEIREKGSRLHRDLDIMFAKIPELEHINVQGTEGGLHKYIEGTPRQVATKTTTASASPPGGDFRQSTAPHRLYSESEPLLQIEFQVNDAAKGPVQVIFGFNRATLQNAVTRAMSILRQAIVLFFCLGLFCLAIALGITIWVAKKTRWLEARMQEIYRRAESAELMSGLVHDLRNPLSSFRANLSSLRIVPEETEVIIDEMEQDLIRLDEKLSSILDLTKKRDERVTPINCADFIAQVERLARPILQQKNIVLKWNCRVHKPVMFMQNGMRDALLNLIINAAQSGQREGAIELDAWFKEGSLYFEVRDHGMGIPKNTNIFAPFVTTKPNGHGLGLAISHRTIDAHGGSIECADRPGGGAIFTIILPQPPTLRERYEFS